MSENYIRLGQFEEGLKEGQTAVQLQPNAEPPYRRLLDAYMCLDRLDEAKKVAENVRTLGIGGARIHQRFLEIAYIEGDQAAAARETQWYAGKPEEYLSFGLQAANRNVLGQRGESSKLYKRAAETALRQGLRDVAAGFEEADARADALSGNCRTARRLGRPALALAMCGDTAQAEKLASGDVEAFSEWNPLECGATTGDSRGYRAPARSTREGGGSAGIRLALRARVPGGGVLTWPGVSASTEGHGGRRRVPEDPGSQGRQLGK